MARRDKLIANAEPYLEPDERVELIASGQTGAPPGPLGAIAAMFGKAKPCHVAVTQDRVYLLKGSMWSTTALKGVLSTHALGSVIVPASGRALEVGGERVYFAALAEDVEAIAERASSDSGA
jgi:hypothetical protein